MNWQDKKNFALNFRHIGEILRYNDFNNDIDIECKYTVALSQETKTLEIKKKKEDNQLTFQLNVNFSKNISLK